MVLEATNLVKHYGDFAALKGLDLSIDAGEVFCLLGANGAGKTTTIQLFLGFIEPTSGSAKIKGLEVKDNPLETKRHLAYIPENVMLYPNLTGIENLSYFSTLAGCASTDEATLRATLLRAGLPGGCGGATGGQLLEGDATKGRHRDGHCTRCIAAPAR